MFISLGPRFATALALFSLSCTLPSLARSYREFTNPALLKTNFKNSAPILFINELTRVYESLNIFRLDSTLGRLNAKKAYFTRNPFFLDLMPGAIPGQKYSVMHELE